MYRIEALVLPEADSRLEKDGIVFWLKNKKIVCGWDNTRVLPTSVFTGLDPFEGIKLVEGARRDSVFYCSVCGKRVSSIHVNYAGAYCDECWDKHFPEKNNVCRICGNQRKDCSC